MWRLIRPLMFQLPTERAHYLSMGFYRPIATCLPSRLLLESLARRVDPRLGTTVGGLKFPNPVGLAAGFDKDARWYHLLDSLGFGSIEIGSLTGEGQPGNPPPRLFRLPLDQAIVNRMGFNNSGAEAAAERLAQVNDRRFRSRSVLGINLGKTKVVPNDQAIGDYLKSMQVLYRFADYFVINVSSPNTPGLRELQDKGHLLELLSAVASESERLALSMTCTTKPLFLKIAPDLTEPQIDEIASVVIEQPVQGIIATNTTTSRDGLKTKSRQIENIGAGGLSGRPLFQRSRAVVTQLNRCLAGRKSIIAVGGIFDGEDAWSMFSAGASLVQLYTGFIYGGPFTVTRILDYLVAKLEREGLSSISELTESARR